MASVYVGTYSTYSNGSIEGAWIDLAGHDAESFAEACAELHEDEEDAEFMFQDYEDFPEIFYSESHLDERLWEYLALDDDEQEIVSAFLDCFGDTNNIFNNAQEAYLGSWNSDADFTYDQFMECNEIPDHLSNYIDFEQVERDYMQDHCESNGRYFISSW